MVEIMRTITVRVLVLLIGFKARAIDIYYVVLKNENGEKQVVDHG